MITDLFSAFADLPDAALAALAGALGLVVVEIIRTAVARSKNIQDDKREVADDLREDIWKLKESIKTLESERDSWRERYFEVKEKLLVLQAAVTVAEIEAEKRRKDDVPGVSE